MADNSSSLSSTPIIKALQERHAGRYDAIPERSGQSPDLLGTDESQFVAERDCFYLASLGATGWPYIQHRCGGKGLVKVIDDHTIAFAESDRSQSTSTITNLLTDARVALVLIDYAAQARLKLSGYAEILDGERAGEWIEHLRAAGEPGAAIARVIFVRVDTVDWTCPLPVTQRFTVEEVQDVLAPFEARLRELEEENARLRRVVADGEYG
jgi:predicted pyridoxine 5'-phosphate oxidase superfamily flavin-nucleotide-binding protein